MSGETTSASRGRRAIVDQRRRLEAKRLAAAGGDDEHAIAALQDCVDRLALPRTELAEAPVALEHQDDGIGGNGGHVARGEAHFLVPGASFQRSALPARWLARADSMITGDWGRCRFYTQAAGAVLPTPGMTLSTLPCKRHQPHVAQQPRRLRLHLVHVLRFKAGAVPRIQQPIRG